jgi:hypothetical protein
MLSKLGQRQLYLYRTIHVLDFNITTQSSTRSIHSKLLITLHKPQRKTIIEEFTLTELVTVYT